MKKIKLTKKTISTIVLMSIYSSICVTMFMFLGFWTGLLAIGVSIAISVCSALATMKYVHNRNDYSSDSNSFDLN